MVSEDLEKERKQCWFSKEEVTYLLDGSKDATDLRRRLERKILSSPGLYEGIGAHDFLGHEEYYEKSVEKAAKLLQACREVDDEDRFDALRLFSSLSFASCIIPDGNPIVLHYAAFLPVIQSQGTEEQQAKWLQRAINCEFIGTYAQTELGHGTNLRAIETTAVYDSATEEFIFNSPTVQSMKWWPGGLGKTANYVILAANLFTEGQNHGLHTFIVQIRSEENHEPLPGVAVGEIGPKYGMKSNDNGFLILKNVIMPRTYMLMKHAQVLPDGTYVKPRSKKLSYGSMVFLRVAICKELGNLLKKAATIVVRYSAVRRQSLIEPNEPEVQIIDFVTQQYKLFPPIAFIFAIRFSAEALWKEYLEVSKSIEGGNVDSLPELHIKSCAMKALISSEAAMFIDSLRRACGGHGYLLSSNLPKIFAQVTAACTYEGENTVLLLQVARGLLKSSSGSKIVARRSSVKKIVRADGTTLEIPAAVSAFDAVTKSRLAEISDELRMMTKSSLSPEAAWNAVSVRLVDLAMSYARQSVVEKFGEEALGSIKSASTGVSNLLQCLCRLQLAYWIREHSGEFIRYGGLTPNDLLDVDHCLEAELKRLRPDAVNVVDAFDIPDEVLDSALGCYDGQVYERLLEVAQKSPLNQRDVPEAYEKYLKPLMEMGSKL